MNPEAQCLTALNLRSCYWQIIRLNLVKRSMKFRSPWRLMGSLWNSRGILSSWPYAAFSMLLFLRGMGCLGLTLNIKPIQTNSEGLGLQVTVRAVLHVENGLGWCWWDAVSPTVLCREALASGQVDGWIAEEQWRPQGDHCGGPLNCRLQVECA